MTADDHELRLDVPNRSSIEEAIHVRLDQPTRVHLSPFFSLGTASSTVDARGNVSQAESTARSRVGPWVTVGVGSLLVLGGIVSAIRVDSLNHASGFAAYRAGLAPSQDACQEAAKGRTVAGAMTPEDVRRYCHHGAWLETAELLCFGLGTTITSVGLAWLLWPEGTTSPATGSGPLTLRLGRRAAMAGYGATF